MEEQELFINSEAQAEPEPQPDVVEEEKPKKKTRKPLSEERKSQLREQLRKGREASLAKRKAGKEAKQKAVEAVKKQVKTPAAELNVPYNMLRDEISGLKELIKNMQMAKTEEVKKEVEPVNNVMRINTPKFSVEELEEVSANEDIQKPEPVKKAASKPATPKPERQETPAHVRSFINNQSSAYNSYF